MSLNLTMSLNLILSYQMSGKCKLATVKSLKANVSSVSPLSERLHEHWIQSTSL